MKRARVEDDEYNQCLLEWKTLLRAYYKDAAVKLAEIVGYDTREHVYSFRLEPHLELIHDDDDVILYEFDGRVWCGDSVYPVDDKTQWPWSLGIVDWGAIHMQTSLHVLHTTLMHTTR